MLAETLVGRKSAFRHAGLWVDEHVDGGLWRPDHWVDRMAYRAYKWVERRLLYCADHVVPLTRRVLSELDALAPRIRVNVSVIRCCADFSHFRILTNETSSVVCRRIGIDRNAVVLSYLGSSGTWYMLDDMLRFLIQTARIRTDIEFLLITRNWGANHAERMRKLGGGDLEGRLHVVSSSRDEVPEYVGSSDLMLSFIKPDYSKIANSPTKLAETYASGTGTPVVSADCSSGPREILEYGGLVSVGDRVALADAIKDASKSAHHHDALKRRAFDIGVAHSTDKHVTLVLKQQDGVL